MTHEEQALEKAQKNQEEALQGHSELRVAMRKR